MKLRFRIPRKTISRPFAPVLGCGALLLAASILCSPVTGQAADSKSKSKSKSSAKTVAVFNLSASITDKPQMDDPLFGTIGTESLRSFCKRLKKAGEDDDVAGVVLLLNGASFDLAHIEEIREVLSAVKDKKPVYAHADSLATGTYAFCTGASRISVSPTGDVWVTGIYGEQMYLRGLLDWAGVEPDFLACGDYKSAAEMFTRKEPSAPAAEMQKWMYDSMFESVLQLIADGRGVDVDQAHEWVDQGLYSAESAQAAKLIDAVETREQLLASIKKELGSRIQLDKKYGKDSGLDIDPNDPFAVLELWTKLLAGPQKETSDKDALAIVHIDGPIMLGKAETSAFGSVEGAYSESIRKSLDEVADDSKVKAVVLRVNSPGGSATASEIILQAVRHVQSKKPVIVSMGSVAGSGGYYVACRANKIFADRTTITGSIGVVAGKLATEAMWEKVGVTLTPIERGKRAGILHSSKPFTSEEKEELQGWMNEVYEIFKGHVTEGRKDKLSKPIDEIAGGRVYMGDQALELGLIDEIGTLSDAIAFAADEGGLGDDYDIRSYPEATNFLEALFADITPAKGDDKRLSLGLWSTLAPMLSELDPVRVRMLQEALLQLDVIQQERVMLSMPVMQTQLP